MKRLLYCNAPEAFGKCKIDGSATVFALLVALLITLAAGTALGERVAGARRAEVRGVSTRSQASGQSGVVVSWGSQQIPLSFYDGKRVIQVAAGGAHNLALKSDGTITAWGDNSWAGQSTVPPNLTGVIQIAAGIGHSLALKSDGTVVAWGYNGDGQSTVPPNLTGVVQVAGGQYHSVALRSNGTVVAWGGNTAGECTVPSNLTGVIQVAAGSAYSLALKSDGTVVAWGNNFYGQCTVPANLSGVIQVAAGDSHSLALKSDGTVVAWGSNYVGQSTVPPNLANVIQVAAGGYHNLALKSDGRVVAWGDNTDGESTVPPNLIGVIQVSASYGHSLVLKSDGTMVAWGFNDDVESTVPANLSGVIQVAAGSFHSLALKSDGTVVAWGRNVNGESTVPPDLVDVIHIAAGWHHSLALKSDGTAVAWGDNSYGQSTVPQNLTGVIQVAGGVGHSVALKSDGIVVAWGDNSFGQSTVPSNLTDVIQVAAAGYHSLALKSDGTVVAWGYNNFGQSTVPPDLIGVVQVVAGTYHSLALKSDGTVVAWGLNSDGQSTIPPNLTGVKQVAGGYSHNLALINPPQIRSLSIHSAANAILTASSDVDDSLKPLADYNLLSFQRPISGGLVADGVTPLLIRLQSSVVPSQSETYQIGAGISGGSLENGLSYYLRVFQPDVNGSGQFVVGGSMTVSPSFPTGFAYVGGIKSDDVHLDSGSKELTVTLTATQTGHPTPDATIQFRIRKPPIVLVHGYNSDNGAWYNDDGTPNGFLAALQSTFPRDFILPVEYGVDPTSDKPDSKNISGAFEELAPLLDSQLRTYVENPSSLWHQAWAFTRYNIVGHSQGGLLVRMLCTSRSTSTNFKPFRSDNNAYRGRFDRVITLNSPHNGSTLLRYFLDLGDPSRNGDPVLVSLLGDLVQEKFDPFAANSQITKIRNNWPVDPAAKFHLIGSSIHDGAPPGYLDVWPPCYFNTHLTDLVAGHQYTRGWVVIPSGSDGVVDFSSEFAGSRTNNKTSLIEGNISHSPPEAIFGAWFGNTATKSAAVAAKVVELLNGSSSDQFGMLNVQPVDPALATQIDNTIPPHLTNWQLIQQFAPSPTPSPIARAASASSVSVYQYRILPQPDQEPAGTPSWYAKIFGPDGVVTDGVTVTPDMNDAKIVSVSVDDNVLGDVVLFVSYTDTNGNVIVGAPVVVVSHQPGANLNGIELVPGTISLTVGSSVLLQVWGDYDNSTRSQLYVPANASISYSSEDSAIASVDSTGRIILNSPGTTDVHVSFLGFSAQSTITVSVAPPPPVITAMTAVSRKMQGTDIFDINLPLTGSPGIECRFGGISGSHQVIVTFATPIAIGGASVSNGAGNVSSYVVNGSELTVNLSGVANAQTVTVTLAGVSDGSAVNDIVIPMAVLLGDVTGNGTVNSSDVSLTKLKSGQALDASNFRNDVNGNGSINSSDVSQVKLNSGTALP